MKLMKVYILCISQSPSQLMEAQKVEENLPIRIQIYGGATNLFQGVFTDKPDLVIFNETMNFANKSEAIDFQKHLNNIQLNYVKYQTDSFIYSSKISEQNFNNFSEMLRPLDSFKFIEHITNSKMVV